MAFQLIYTCFYHNCKYLSRELLADEVTLNKDGTCLERLTEKIHIFTYCSEL